MFKFLTDNENSFLKDILDNTKINLELHIIGYHDGYESVKGLIKENLILSDKEYEEVIKLVESQLGVYDEDHQHICYP